MPRTTRTSATLPYSPILLLLLLLSPCVFLARLQEQSNLQAAEFVLLPRGIIRFNALLLLLHMQWRRRRGKGKGWHGYVGVW